MGKTIYEFTNIFAVLFFMIAAFFFFKGLSFLAFIAFLSSVFVKFSNSDWAFDNLKFSNHNMFVIIFTFFLVCVNVFYIFQEIRYSPIFIKVKKEDQANYLMFENALYKAIEPCTKEHNKVMRKLNSNEPVYEIHIKNANTACRKVGTDIDKAIIPENFPEAVKVLCFSNKDNFKRIAINLSVYNYSVKEPQPALINRIKECLENSVKNMVKIREMMHMMDELEDKKINFIDL